MASGEAMSSPFAPLTNQQLHQQQTSSQDQEHPPPPPAKKKRNLPGTPDPEAEVIALSPRTLMATNRFVCEICGKGFQRDQNLQLHRRGHNLPWKLRQRGKDQPRKRVYVCPEKGCVHHNPSRALGDLTGIKKHFCRKHGEKKWKCDKCAKKYAVQSDWKAHAKTCGTREYRCDCGTLFSRRDSFITHRAFCDALAEETARLQQTAAASGGGNAGTAMCGGGGPSYGLFGGSAAGPMSVRPNNTMLVPPAPGQMPGHGALSLWGSSALPSSLGLGQNIAAGAPMPMPMPMPAPQMYADVFAPSSGGAQFDMAQLNWLYGNGNGGGKQLSSSNASELTTTNSSREADSSAPSVFSGQHHAKPASAATADMSATALLQKAAQIGAVTSNNATMPLVGGFVEQPVKSPVEERCKFDGGALFGASHQQQHGANNNNGSSAMSELTAANTGYDVYAAARHGGGLKDAVGREETRDFLGVGMQALCSSSIHGWI